MHRCRLVEGPRRVRAPIHEQRQVVLLPVQSDPPDTQGRAVRPVDAPEDQSLIGTLQSADFPGQTLDDEFPLVGFAGAVRRGLQHLRPIGSRLGKPLGEQLV